MMCLCFLCGLLLIFFPFSVIYKAFKVTSFTDLLFQMVVYSPFLLTGCFFAWMCPFYYFIKYSEISERERDARKESRRFDPGT